jgi:integrase
MFVFAAHTGARRSEILRSQIDDFDFGSRMVISPTNSAEDPKNWTINETKPDRSTNTNLPPTKLFLHGPATTPNPAAQATSTKAGASRDCTSQGGPDARNNAKPVKERLRRLSSKTLLCPVICHILRPLATADLRPDNGSAVGKPLEAKPCSTSASVEIGGTANRRGR